MYIGLHAKYPSFLSDFTNTFIFFLDFQKKILKNQISLKSIQWEHICSMRTDGHNAANSRFSQFCERA